MTSLPATIGIIGVGEIAAAMVDGLNRLPEPPKIILSPRGSVTASALARRYPRVSVAPDNQTVADDSTVLILSVRPDQVGDALSGLQLQDGTVLISAVAATGLDTLARQVEESVTITRTIPMPAVRHGSGITAIHPDEPVTRAIFASLGTVVAVADETAFGTLSVCSATVSTLLGYLAEIADWAAEHGVPDAAADTYLKSIVAGVGEELADPEAGLAALAHGHETPGGLNEQLRTTWLDADNRTALRRALDGVRDRTVNP